MSVGESHSDRSATGSRVKPRPVPRIAVLIPCYNEAATIGKVVGDFRAAIPGVHVYVCDNNSSDNTAELAVQAGATVFKEPRQGKGPAVRTLFDHVDADIYLMVDGDDTYPADAAGRLIQQVEQEGYDMCVGNRLGHFTSGSFRSFHLFGNRMICGMINLLFRSQLQDVLSGYRCFSGRFAKFVPVLSSGFEVEVELTLQALDKGFSIREEEIAYGERPEGSVSKLNTWNDGLIILRAIFHMFKDYRPLLFFGVLAMVAILIGLAAGSVVVEEFIRTGLIQRIPLAIFAVGSVLSGFVAMTAGLILDTVNLRMKELWRLQLRGNGKGWNGM